MKASPDYARFVEAFLTWQGLRRELFASTPLFSWDSARLLVQSAAAMEDYARSVLEQVLADSDSELRPLGDPLRLNLGRHRWLSADREESYSDWLAWILQGIADAAEILPLFAVRDDSAGGLLGRAERVSREVPGEHGRTDVEVWFGERGLLLIEVKVQPTDENLPLQLERYKGWAAKQQVAQRLLVLLGTEEPKQDIGKFVFTHWRDLCIRLRRYAQRIKGSDQLRGAAILMFCGAVEQNLLGLSERPAPFRAMATVEYLREWRRKA